MTGRIDTIAGEHPVAHIAQHWMTYVSAFLLMLASWALYALCTLVSLNLREVSHPLSTALFIAGHVLLLLFHHAAFYKFVCASMSHFLLTNRRILGSLQRPWFSDEVVDVPLMKVRTLEVKKTGVLQHVLDYGLIILNKSELPSLHRIPRPQRVHHIIVTKIQERHAGEAPDAQQDPVSPEHITDSPPSTMQLPHARRDTAHPHYYGSIVRRLFLAGGIIILVTLAIFKHVLPLTTFISVLLILLIGLLAGLTNPRQTWVAVLDMFVSVAALVFFEYHAVTGYENFADALFLINQVLAIIFFFALYYSTKTLRGALLSH